MRRARHVPTIDLDEDTALRAQILADLERTFGPVVHQKPKGSLFYEQLSTGGDDAYAFSRERNERRRIRDEARRTARKRAALEAARSAAAAVKPRHACRAPGAHPRARPSSQSHEERSRQAAERARVAVEHERQFDSLASLASSQVERISVEAARYAQCFFRDRSPVELYDYAVKKLSALVASGGPELITRYNEAWMALCICGSGYPFGHCCAWPELR